MPLGLYGLYRFPKVIPSLLLLISALAAFLSFSLTQIPQGTYIYAFSAAILFSLISASFWILHHRALSLKTTEDNIGNEVSISAVVDSVGSALGLVIGGGALAYGAVLAPVAFFIMFFAGTTCLYITNKKITANIKEKQFNPLQKIKNTNISISLMTAFHGFVQLTCSSSAPVWLGMLGAKSLLTGALMAINVIIDFIVSPFIGHFFHNRKKQEMKIGSALITLGWLPFIFLQNAFYTHYPIFFGRAEKISFMSVFYPDGMQIKVYQG